MNQLIELIKTYPDQVNATAALMALTVSLLVSLTSIILTIMTLRIQRNHNFKSVTPIANILTGDYEDELEVKLTNTGIGPLIINKFIAANEGREEDNIISLMPGLPHYSWTTFTRYIDGRSIAPNQELILIQLNGDMEDESFVLIRDEVRRALSQLTVAVSYRDIYDRQMPPCQRKLDWFGRHFNGPDALLDRK